MQTTEKGPAISVVMPTHNTPVPWLKEAVESILNQTFGDFEFLIIDDGSTNDSPSYLAAIDDPRVRVITNPENIGITKSLNVGLRAARGKYIARMDSDDISEKERFAKQYAHMETHPETVICGTWAKNFGTTEGPDTRSFTDQESYRIDTLFHNPGPMHSTVFFRREVLEKHAITYDESMPYVQDYEIFSRLCQYGGVDSLQTFLLRRRRHEQQICSTKGTEQRLLTIEIRRRLLEALMGPTTMEEAYSHVRIFEQPGISEEAIRWFHSLIQANRISHIYDQKRFEAFINDMITRKTKYKYRISWSRPWRYAILLRYLPISYLMKKGLEKVRKIIFKGTRQ